jgi:glucose-1-phosphatase
MLKNIIFDLGNVLIDIDFPRSEKELVLLLGDDALENLEKMGQKNLFLDFETGKISEKNFVEILKKTSPNIVSDQQIIDAWNAMLIGFKPERFEMLRRLASKYTLYVLSNTNSTHIDWVRKDLKKNYEIEAYETTFFTKVYYSHEIHLRKPDVEIYEFVLADAQLDASETLFIDDNFDNIESAKKANLQTIHHLLGNEIVTVLKDF